MCCVFCSDSSKRPLIDKQMIDITYKILKSFFTFTAGLLHTCTHTPHLHIVCFLTAVCLCLSVCVCVCLCVTVIGDDDVDTLMKVELFEAVHQLAYDSVHSLQSQDQLHTHTTHTHTHTQTHTHTHTHTRQQMFCVENVFLYKSAF